MKAPRSLVRTIGIRPPNSWHGMALHARLGPMLFLPLLMFSLHGGDVLPGGSAQQTAVPRFTRAEMEADLEHLTACLKRACSAPSENKALGR